MNEDINCNNKRLYVDYNGIITDKSYSVLVKNIEFALRTFSFNEIYFCLSSGGGNVNAGLEIYSYFKNLKNISVIMHGYSYIGSIANIIFLSCNKRYATSNCTFLLHGISQQLNGQFSTNQLDEILSNMRQDEDRLQKIYLDNTKLTDNEIKDLFQSGKAKNTQYAKEKEIIIEEKEYLTDIKEPKIMFISMEEIKPNGLIMRDIQTIYFGLPQPSI